MTDGLVWEEPPTEGQRKFPAGYWLNIVHQLEARPNEWAMVYEQSEEQGTTAARNRRVMVHAAAKRLDIPVEVVSRDVNGRIKIYARVVSE